MHLSNIFHFFLQAGVMSGQQLILGWIKDIVNHFWFSCEHASNREEFMVSVLIRIIFVLQLASSYFIFYPDTLYFRICGEVCYSM